MMDIDSLAKGVGLFSSALSALKQALALLPNSPRKADAEVALKRSEEQFKLAEAMVATKLNYPICRRHFPPGVMLLKHDDVWECRECHQEEDHGLPPPILGSDPEDGMT